MLLTLSAKSVWKMERRSAAGTVRPEDVPRWARNELGVHGLTIQTSLLAGWNLPRIDRFRDEADKTAVPCLVLVEDQPLDLATEDEAHAAAAVERSERVLRVAHRLGCSSVAISILDRTGESSIETTAPRLRKVLAQAEHLELNLLLAPAPGLTETQERMTGLIRKVGGFRIGSYPDFEVASRTPDPTVYLRGLAPYATCVCVAFAAVDASGKVKGYNLSEYVEAIHSVGFEAALALEYRGKGNPLPPLRAAKAEIDAAWRKKPVIAALDEEDDEMDDLEDDE